MKNQGFSLFELMIVLAILTLLMSIAYPSYTDYLIRTRRCDGQTALLDLANRMESYYSRETTYSTATIGLNKPSDLLTTNLSAGGWYTLSIIEQTESTFKLLATAREKQALDKACLSLSFDNFGAKTASPGNQSACWSS